MRSPKAEDLGHFSSRKGSTSALEDVGAVPSTHIQPAKPPRPEVPAHLITFTIQMEPVTIETSVSEWG